MACRRRNRLLVGRAHWIRLAVAATGKRPDGLPATVIGASPARWEEGPRPWRLLESWGLFMELPRGIALRFPDRAPGVFQRPQACRGRFRGRFFLLDGFDERCWIQEALVSEHLPLENHTAVVRPALVACLGVSSAQRSFLPKGKNVAGPKPVFRKLRCNSRTSKVRPCSGKLRGLGLGEFLSQNGADLRRSCFGWALALLPGLLLCLAALSFGGCVGFATRFTPYSGSAAVHPGNRRGAFVEQVEGIPVYYSEPDRPYRILGVLHVAKRGPRPLAHSILTHQWMEEVRKLGGNAVWILTEQREIAGYSGLAPPEPITGERLAPPPDPPWTFTLCTSEGERCWCFGC